MALSRETLLRTPLYSEHVGLGARMVPFAGWEMPVQYTGVIDEHNAVRQGAGMFDVSHMGRFEVHGPDAGRFLRYITTWDITRLAPGEGHYAAACNEAGGILDDVYVFCLDSERLLIVVNAWGFVSETGFFAERSGRDLLRLGTQGLAIALNYLMARDQFRLFRAYTHTGQKPGSLFAPGFVAAILSFGFSIVFAGLLLPVVRSLYGRP